MQVFRHALAAADVGQRQAMADQAVECCARLRRFVELGQDAGDRALAEARHRLLDRRALLSGGNHGETAHAQRIERLSLAGARIVRREAGGVDQHQFFVSEVRQQPGAVRSLGLGPGQCLRCG